MSTNSIEPMKIFLIFDRRFLMETPGFIFEERSRDLLPKELPPDTEGTCYFLNDYKHAGIDESDTLDVHIDAALKEYDINSL